MSFFSDEQRNTDGTFESGGGDFEPIPANTGCLAAIKQTEWVTYDNERYINIRWQVLQPEAYKNRMVFQKLRVLDIDPSKSDRAKRMLAAIDSNAGGKLVALGREPSDSDLASALVGKIQAIKLQVWKLTTESGEERSGNWVSAVSPSKAGQTQQPAPVEQQPSVGASSFDDVPFMRRDWRI